MADETQPSNGNSQKNRRDEEVRAVGRFQTSWRTTEPKREEFGKFVTEQNAMRSVGQGGVFERGAHVPVSHFGYFRPPLDAFLTKLESRDRRSAKEW